MLQQYRSGLMAQHADNRFKVMAYKYDLVSGKVNQVHYQPGQADQLYHRYDYDAENRITDVFTTDNKLLIGDVNLEEHDAHYDYYKHGPLAKTVLGHQRVQGIDYAYTLQGWLKGVNSDSLLDNDGLSSTGGAGGGVAKDAYRFSLNYFNGDYNAISYSMANAFPGHSGYMGLNAAEYKPLYNDNISSMVVGIPKLGETQLYNYGYDQLNRLVSMDAWKGYDAVNMHWQNIQKMEDYKERISYDANGNILSYLRNGNATRLSMDEMAYSYKAGTNQLDKVVDAAPDASAGEYDKYGDIKQGQLSGNYTYDAIGNLIKDNAEKITNIEWSVYGKILKITKTAINTGDVSAISYTYDAAGNRISKRVEALNKQDKYTWYTRDASGNTMAVYEYEGTNTNNNTLYLKEQHLYGSSRLGVWNRNVNMDEKLATTTIPLLGPTQSGSFERGNKFFELINHLGNVLATVNDKKIAHDAGNGTIDYYLADVMSASDYAPFGMQMPGRKYTSSSSSYRFGFGGKEMDNEIKGEGNQIDYGARIYDTRLGRFLSVDPLTKNYPMLTPYQYASNSPIALIDIDGLEGVKPRVVGNTYPSITYLTSEQIEEHVSSLNVTGVPTIYIKDLLKGEGITLSMYDADQNNRTTPESHGGNATIGIGHLIHLGAIGSTQYDPNALSAEEPFKNGLTLDEVFTLFSNDLQIRVNGVNKNLSAQKIKDVDENTKAVFVDLRYNAPSREKPAEVIYKKGMKYLGNYGGDQALYRAIDKGVIKSISEERKKMRLKSIERAIQKDIQKLNMVDDPRKTKPRLQKQEEEIA